MLQFWGRATQITCYVSHPLDAPLLLIERTLFDGSRFVVDSEYDLAAIPISERCELGRQVSSSLGAPFGQESSGLEFDIDYLPSVDKAADFRRLHELPNPIPGLKVFLRDHPGPAKAIVPPSRALSHEVQGLPRA